MFKVFIFFSSFPCSFLLSFIPTFPFSLLPFFLPLFRSQNIAQLVRELNYTFVDHFLKCMKFSS